jgi:RNA polymerase sigma factor (sigma-70 family)
VQFWYSPQSCLICMHRRDRQRSTLLLMNKLKKTFFESYKEHSDEIFRFALFKLSDREKAKDLVQEVFTKTWLYLSKNGKITNIRAFLYKTARNAIIDEYRRHSRREGRHESLDNLSVLGYDPGYDDIDQLINQMDGEILMEMIRELPEISAEIMFLRYAENKSISEIADIVGRSDNAVSVYLNRGIKKLKKIITEKYKNIQ